MDVPRDLGTPSHRAAMAIKLGENLDGDAKAAVSMPHLIAVG